MKKTLPQLLIESPSFLLALSLSLFFDSAKKPVIYCQLNFRFLIFTLFGKKPPSVTDSCFSPPYSLPAIYQCISFNKEQVNSVSIKDRFSWFN